MPTTRPFTICTPRARAASNITIPSCCALSQPARRACATATVSGDRKGKCRRIKLASVITSAPVNAIVETAIGRRRVGTLGRIMKPGGAPATRLGRFRHRLKKRNLARVGGREHIATPIEIDPVVGRARDPSMRSMLRFMKAVMDQSGPGHQLR